MSRRILEIESRPLDVPMKKPFGIAGGAQTTANNVLVRVVAEGWGEGAPFPAFNGETQSRALAACALAGPLLTGCELDASDALLERIRSISSDSPSAACAIETAIFDLRARAAGRSLHAYLGGAEDGVTTDMTITTGSVEDAEAEARAFRAFGTLKIKVGGGDVDDDVKRVLAVRAARPDARIVVDANGGYSVDEAVRFAALAAAASIQLFEQPIPPGEWDALAEVRRRTRLRVGIDESVTKADDVTTARRREAADLVNVKIMKSGIFEALAIIDRARAEGLDRMIGGMVETRLAMGASACIAAGIGGFSLVDLDTPLFLAEDPFEGGYAQIGERIDVRPITLGLGTTPRAT